MSLPISGTRFAPPYGSIAMRPETRRRLNWLVWKSRARVAVASALGLALLAALYAYANWPDPIVETRIVSGVVTNWAKAERKLRQISVITIWASLDDGREIIFTQWLPDVIVSGPAEIEERHHQSGELSFRWVKSTLHREK
jgi:hypothetical protein